MPIVESHAGTPDSTLAVSEWVHPTGTYFPYSGSYSDYPYDPEYPQPTSSNNAASAASLGHETSGQNMGRGANYFFGFLITFIILLLLFVACGIGRRRRNAARRRRQRAEELENGSAAGMFRFAGLLAGTQNDGGRIARRLANEEILKHKPTYHEIWLSTNEKRKSKSEDWETVYDKAAGIHTKKSSWSQIEPLAATLVRTPKDLHLYQHFHDTLATNATQHQRSLHVLLPSYETADRARPWYGRILSASSPRALPPGDTRRNVVTNASLPSSGPYRQGNDSKTSSVEKINPRNDSGSEIEKWSEEIEVAVMVVMPSEFRPQYALSRERSERDLDEGNSSASIHRPIPECQIGVAQGRFIESGFDS